MKNLWVMLIPLCLAVPAFATVDCDGGVAHDADECAAFQATAQVDRKLNALYQRILSDLKAKERANDNEAAYNAEARKEFVKGQKIWTTLVEADCQAVFHRELDGSARFAIQARCVLAHKRQRLHYLEAFKSGRW